MGRVSRDGAPFRWGPPWWRPPRLGGSARFAALSGHDAGLETDVPGTMDC